MATKSLMLSFELSYLYVANSSSGSSVVVTEETASAAFALMDFIESKADIPHRRATDVFMLSCIIVVSEMTEKIHIHRMQCKELVKR